MDSIRIERVGIGECHREERGCIESKVSQEGSVDCDEMSGVSGCTDA